MAVILLLRETSSKRFSVAGGVIIIYIINYNIIHTRIGEFINILYSPVYCNIVVRGERESIATPPPLERNSGKRSRQLSREKNYGTKLETSPAPNILAC